MSRSLTGRKTRKTETSTSKEKRWGSLIEMNPDIKSFFRTKSFRILSFLLLSYVHIINVGILIVPSLGILFHVFLRVLSSLFYRFVNKGVIEILCLVATGFSNIPLLIWAEDVIFGFYTGCKRNTNLQGLQRSTIIQLFYLNLRILFQKKELWFLPKYNHIWLSNLNNKNKMFMLK